MVPSSRSTFGFPEMTQGLLCLHHLCKRSPHRITFPSGPRFLDDILHLTYAVASRRLRLILKGQGEVRMRGQGKVRMKGSGRGQDERSGQGQACRDMSRQRALQTHPGDGPATKPTNQEPTRSPRRPIRNRHRALGHQSPLSPRFLPYMGGLARTIKPFPTLTDSADSLYSADSPRSLASPPPGVLPESNRPIKGPVQRSIGVAPSSRGVSYKYHPQTQGTKKGECERQV